MSLNLKEDTTRKNLRRFWLCIQRLILVAAVIGLIGTAWSWISIWLTSDIQQSAQLIIPFAFWMLFTVLTVLISVVVAGVNPDLDLWDPVDNETDNSGIAWDDESEESDGEEWRAS